MSDLTTIENYITGSLFNAHAIGCLLPIGNHIDKLSTDELTIIGKFSQKRQHEFSTGRFCAKNVFAAYGMTNVQLLRNDHREPIWPNGFVGSISHCKDICGAYIAKKTNLKALGFDIENIRPLKQDITDLICTAQEKSLLAKEISLPYHALLILLFSLKEAIFKCVFADQKIRIGFHDCSIEPNLISKQAKVIFHRNDVNRDLELNFMISENHIFSGAYYKQ
jgi:4'-phosphopantetheinyl transferase EntD